MNFTYLENITLVVFRKVSTRPALIHHQGFLGSTKEDKWCLKNQPPIGIFKSFIKERMLSIRDPTFQFLEVKTCRVWKTIDVLQLKFIYSWKATEIWRNLNCIINYFVALVFCLLFEIWGKNKIGKVALNLVQTR